MSEHGGGSSRRRGREVALQVLYAMDVARRQRPPAEPDGDALPLDPDAEARVAHAGDDPGAVFRAIAESFEMPAAARRFAEELFLCVREHVDELDAAIRRHSSNWRLERMATVDRNILRLGAYELAFTDTPAAVVLNEAVDLARRFGSEPSPAFVNGILDALARDVRDGGDARDAREQLR